MTSHSTSSTWSLIAVGVLVALVLGFGLSAINKTIEGKYVSSNTYLESAVPLSGNRFAVVGSSITVYEVQPNGDVKLISHVTKSEVPAK